MPIFANSRRNRSIPAVVLLGWLFALFVGIASGCAVSDTVHNQVHAFASAHADGDGHDAHETGSIYKGDLCKIACDAKISPMVKEKSFDPSNTDHLALQTLTYILPLSPAIVFISDTPRNASLLYDHAVSLRSTRLTL